LPALVLDLLKYVFLIVLYIFVGRAVRAVYLELRATTPRAAGRASPAQARPPSRKAKKAPRKVAVIEGENHRGKTFELNGEMVIGRSDKCHMMLDDPYVSQVHARLFPRGDAFMVEDMGSTNGTYLNRKRLTSPTELKRGDRIKIGKTVLELRR
jgi:pSer/pThr/pTyr-binding forkhead associated (FHA) protein